MRVTGSPLKPIAPFSLTCFGVGDGWPCADRNGSSFLYRFDGQTVLIDCGEPISRSFRAAGLHYDLIDHILLSHLHFDHVGGFFMLIQGFWLHKRRKPLHVHAPSDGIQPIRQMLAAGCIFDELIGFPLRYHPLQPNQGLPAGELQIVAYPTTHLSVLRDCYQALHPQKFEAFSFLLQNDRVRIGHSADIGAVEDLMPLVERPLDLLVCELAHVPVPDLFQFLQPREIGRIIFVHVAQEHRAHLSDLQRLADRILGRQRAIWPRDGQTFQFPMTTRPTHRVAAKNKTTVL